MIRLPSPYHLKIGVLEALNNMPDILNSRELCWMEDELATGCGVVVGDQIRLKRSDGIYALYTVSAFHKEKKPYNVRMGPKGRHKLEAAKSLSDVDLFVGGDILRSGLSDNQAEAQSEFVERLTDNGAHTGLVALAPHGGGIEPWTDRQAERVATQLVSKGVSSWRCKGWHQNGNAHDRWHIDAGDISRNSFPLLDAIGDRGFTHAVCFHGFGQDGILIGGLAPQQLKLDIRDAIIAAINDVTVDVTIAGINAPHNGMDPTNIVNWLTVNGAGGIQIEQSVDVRSNHWHQIADAVASVFDPLI